MKKFNMTNIDAMVAYEKFYKKYPNGEINKDQFTEVRNYVNDISFTRPSLCKEHKENIMKETFFKIFDEDGSGTLRF